MFLESLGSGGFVWHHWSMVYAVVQVSFMGVSLGCVGSGGLLQIGELVCALAQTNALRIWFIIDFYAGLCFFSCTLYALFVVSSALLFFFRGFVCNSLN